MRLSFLTSFLFLLFCSTSSAAAQVIQTGNGNIGDVCGGFLGLSCHLGLTCVIPPSEITVSDADGICKDISSITQTSSSMTATITGSSTLKSTSVASGGQVNITTISGTSLQRSTSLISSLTSASKMTVSLSLTNGLCLLCYLITAVFII